MLKCFHYYLGGIIISRFDDAILEKRAKEEMKEWRKKLKASGVDLKLPYAGTRDGERKLTVNSLHMLELAAKIDTDERFETVEFLEELESFNNPE